VNITTGTRDETPMYFEAAGRRLFGVLTQPTTAPRGIAVVLASGGSTGSTNRNRVFVRLCRTASRLGFHAFRFDYHGMGESEGTVSTLRLDRPFTDDLMGAIAAVRRQGVERVALIGDCFGARTALSCAPDLDRLEGVALIAAPVGDYEMGGESAARLAAEMSLAGYARTALHPRIVLGLFQADHRRAYARIAREKVRRLRRPQGNGQEKRLMGASDRFMTPLAELVRRDIPTLLVYGADDGLWHDFERAREGTLGELLQRPGGVEIATLPGKVHAFTNIPNQDAVLDRLTRWLSDLPARVRSSATT
jgi:pimeloyl-ACP methyl ester carboxylesterase